MKIEIYEEICCEVCRSVIHNHIDCPACGKEYAPTDAYHGLYEWEERPGFELSCESCKTKFRLTSNEGWLDDWEWEQIQ